jgi:hypothetical protein
VAFRRGKNVAALACVRAGLERAIFEHEGVDDKELGDANLDPIEWTMLTIRCLLEANAIATDGNFFKWQTEVGQVIEKEISGLGLRPPLTYVAGKLKPQNREGSQNPSANFVPRPSSVSHDRWGLEVQTVHGVKGETHDVTAFVCPDTTKAHCPSRVWWSTDDRDREERRIAYVAMTRTRGDLILCVSEACYKRLVGARPAFVARFECMTIAELILGVDRNNRDSNAELTSTIVGLT